MRIESMRRAIGGAGAMMAVLLFSCDREYESPYLPGSGNYAGDEWTRDKDGNGVADMVDSLAPGCDRPPKECMELAKVISRIGLGYTLVAVDMILWEGATGAEPRLIWVPQEASARGFILTSSDTTKVRVKDGRLDAVGVGNVQISVGVPNESRSASFIARVVPNEGKRVVSISAEDLTLEAGREGAPLITWNPPDADYKDYSLFIDDEDRSVGIPFGNNIKALFPGTAKITVEALDGGKRTAFTLKVTEPGQRVEAVSVEVEDMYLVAGEPAEAPIIRWNPSNVSEKRYLLAPADTTVARVNKDRDSIVPLRPGITQVNLYTLDGGGKSAYFTVQVSETAVPVLGLAAADMKLAVGSAPVYPRLAWNPGLATNRKFSLVSEDPQVAAVDGNLIVPLSLGMASLRAISADGGHQAGFLVEVVPQDTGIHVDSIKAADISLPAGASRAPLVTWYPEDAGNQIFTMTSADSTVALIDRGSVLALKAGNTTVTVRTADGGKTATFKVNVATVYIPVQTVQGSPMSLVVGQVESPSLAWLPGTASNLSYSLSSDNSSIARIVDSTSVEGVAVGTANIIVRSKDGPSDTIPVTINAKAIQVTALAVANFTMAVGDPDKDVSVLIQWTPSNATVKTFKLISSSNAAAIGIIENKLRAYASGASNVVIESQDAAKARDTFTVTVKQPVKGVAVRDTSVWPGTADIDPARLTTWTPVNADDKSYTLTSLDTLVASVINGNRVRPKASGSANIILRSLENSTKADTFKVTVMVPVKTLTIRDTTVYVGMKHINPYPSVTWNPATATDKNWDLIWVGAKTTNVIDSVGWWFNAVGPGTVSLIFRSSQNPLAEDTFVITVIQSVGSVTASPLPMKVGDPDAAPILTWIPADVTNKSYTLSGGTAGIATVVANKVHAEGPGTANFTVKTTDGGKTVSFTATVAQPVSSIATVSFNMKVGDPDAVPSITWMPANASDKGYTLTGGTPGIATVAGNKVHAEGAGSANFTVKTNDGAKTSQFSVNVGKPVTGISAAPITMGKGEPDRDPVLTWTPADATNKGYTLTGGNGSVASVVNNRIHAIGGGTVGFTVTTTDGNRTAAFNVTVNVPVISVQGMNTTMRRNDPDKLPQLTWTPADATDKGYTLTSSAPTNVSIVEGTKLRAVSTGSAIITVTTHDGQKKDTFTVEVRNF